MKMNGIATVSISNEELFNGVDIKDYDYEISMSRLTRELLRISLLETLVLGGYVFIEFKKALTLDDFSKIKEIVNSQSWKIKKLKGRSKNGK